MFRIDNTIYIIGFSGDGNDQRNLINRLSLIIIQSSILKSMQLYPSHKSFTHTYTITHSNNKIIIISLNLKYKSYTKQKKISESGKLF